METKHFVVAIKSTQVCHVCVEATDADAAKTIADTAIDDSPGLNWEAFDKYASCELREASVLGNASVDPELKPLKEILDDGCDHRVAYYFHENAPKYCPICGEYVDKV